MSNSYSGKQIADAVFGYGDWTFKKIERTSLWSGFDNLAEMKFSPEQIREFRLLLQFCADRIFEKEYNPAASKSVIVDLFSTTTFKMDESRPNGYKSVHPVEFQRRAHQAFVDEPKFKRNLHESFMVAMGEENKTYTAMDSIPAAPEPAQRRPRLIKKLAIPALTQ